MKEWKSNILYRFQCREICFNNCIEVIIDSHCHLVLHIFDNDIEIAIKQQTTHQL